MSNLRVLARNARPRGPIAWLAGGLLTLGLVEVLLLKGLMVPCRVVGSSMAPELWGPHRNVICGDCGYRFVCAADGAPQAACPNCGWPSNPLDALNVLPGPRVLIDRTAYGFRAPRRWEIAAFRDPRQADRLAIKRIVGLPGEDIEVREGDVFADGRIARKNLEQQRRLAIPVYDANFSMVREENVPPRWRAGRSDSRWSVEGGRFRCEVDAAVESRVDWLVYHHQRRLPDGGWRQSPVMDLSGIDPSHPRREEDVHAMSDLMLSMDVGKAMGRGALWIRLADGRARFEARLALNDAAPRWRIFRNGRLIASGELPRRPAEGFGFGRLEASMIDQQFLLALDDRTLAALAYDRPEPPRRPTTRPAAIGVEGIGLELCDVRLLRDVYYTDPIRPAKHGMVHLPANGYYVLGDNSPISQDSRTWSAPAWIDAKSLIGKPLAAIPSVSIGRWGAWQFQVPNPAGIRYIR